MNLRQLTAFAEVMLSGSVSEAARSLGRTQPSVSHQIASLEASLGLRLFERRGGRLHPVPEAHYLFEEVAPLLERLRTVRVNMARLKALDRGQIRIASMPGPSVFLLPALLARQFGPRSEVRSSLYSRSSDAVLQLVASQQFDLGIADHDPDAEVATKLVTRRIFRFDWLCAVRRDDPLAKWDAVGPADLDGRPVALLYPEHRSRRLLGRSFAAAGSRLAVRFEAQYFIPLLTFVEHGLAASIVDPLSAEAYRLYRGASGTLRFVPFRGAGGYELALLAPRYRPASIAAAAFRGALVAELKRLGGRSDAAAGAAPRGDAGAD